MKANEFVKNHGIETSKALISRAHKEGVDTTYFVYSQKDDCFHNHCWDETDVWLSELKRLVESHELVAIHGFEKSKEIVANAPSDDHFYSWTLGSSGVRDKTVNIGELRKAIADVERCCEIL